MASSSRSKRTPVKISSVDFGTDAPSYSTQTRDDYKAPHGEARGAAAIVVKSTLRLGESGSSWATETSEKFGPPVGFKPSKSVLPRNNHSVVELGTDKVDMSATTHRAGFPPREIDLGSLGQNKTATLEINRAHFVLGDEPPASRYTTTYRTTMASEEAVREAARSAKSADAYVPPKTGKFSSWQPGPEEHTDYSTTNAMPRHAEYKKLDAIDPRSWAGIGTTSSSSSGDAAGGAGGGGGIEEVWRKLSTSGKPLSAVAFGYDVPEYKSDYMRSAGMSPGDKKLREPYVPRLVPRYVTDHPALQGTPLKAPSPGARAAAVSRADA